MCQSPRGSGLRAGGAALSTCKGFGRRHGRHALPGMESGKNQPTPLRRRTDHCCHASGYTGPAKGEHQLPSGDETMPSSPTPHLPSTDSPRQRQPARWGRFAFAWRKPAFLFRFRCPFAAGAGAWYIKKRLAASLRRRRYPAVPLRFVSHWRNPRARRGKPHGR